VAFAAFPKLLLMLGVRGFAGTGSRVLGGTRLGGCAAQFFDACSDRREVVCGVGSGHLASCEAALDAVRSGPPSLSVPRPLINDSRRSGSGR
jgi:hypothetical protein